MIRKIFHMVLAILVLMLTTGWTINVHYCHDELVDVGVNAPAKSCCDGPSGDSACQSGSMIGQKNHCEYETFSVESTDQFFISSFSFEFNDNHQIDLTHHYQTIDEFPGTLISSIIYKFPGNKIPPSKKKDILSRIQSYII
ncbi:MAG: hypothetical protein KAR19_05715 [Bacteroidales bacterium]|nr:hypothetical protein [Bacteroidales bacterium]